MNDPIVDEVRRIRDAYAATFNYDLDAIFRDIKEKERTSGRKYVSFTVDLPNRKPLGPTTTAAHAGQMRKPAH